MVDHGPKEHDMSVTPTYTIIFMIVLAVLVIGIDIVLAVNKNKGDTYSEALRAAGKKWIAVVILISFGMGLLAGHWFWSSAS